MLLQSVILQAMPGNGTLIVANESVHLSKLCRAELTEHNCPKLPLESPLLTLLSLALKSNGTKSPPSDLRAFFPVQHSSQFLFLSQSRVIAGMERCQGSALADAFGTGRGLWWVRVYGILNRERRVCVLSWSSTCLCSLTHGLAASDGVPSCFTLMAFFVH